MRFLPLLILPGILFVSTVLAQEIKNISYAQEGNKVRLEFDLIGNSSERYFIALYSSIDNYARPLQYVTGDVGKNIQPGKKVISWDAKKELGNYQGNIRFKLKARFIPLLTFTNIDGNTKFKKGKSYTITWRGGPEKGSLHLDLLSGTEKVASLATVGNTGTWTWKVPKKIAKGSYRIRASADGRTQTSENFKIVPKVPLLAVIIPGVAVAGVAVAILISHGSGNNDIPDPPKPN